jgi:hypothetical protein
MSTGRYLTSYLLLGLLTVLALGGAVLGVVQSPKSAPLISCTSPQQPIEKCTGAVPNTLGAANYSEVLNETTPQGKQTDYLTYQAPDRLGGYIQSGSRRTYVYVIGTSEYQSLTVAAGTYTFTISETTTQGKAIGTFNYTVTGPYVSQFTLDVAQSSVDLVISQVGSSPPVELPAGAKVVNAGA